MRSIHFSIYNSTHMTFTRNFALQGNVGDIVAKDDSQQTVAHLLGLLTGVTLLTFNHTPAFLFSVFFLVGPLHYWATIAFLNAIRFEVLSSTKMLLLSDAYVNRNRTILSYNAIEKESNTVWFGEWIKPSWSGVKISKIGGSAENYLLSHRKGKYGATFHEDATPKDVIKAILHIVKLDRVVKDAQAADPAWLADPSNYKRALAETLVWVNEEFPDYLRRLEEAAWMSDSVFWGDEGNRCHWER
ncbi:hypothetical protein BC830DRAFT_1057045 [Chytriomyces sp. MP71]|nr:hypothetical protein BC830DRAFT_1057045 [Chytriomyces sp. MP71]